MGEARDVIGERYGDAVHDAQGPGLQDQDQGRAGGPRGDPADVVPRDPDSLAGMLKPEELRLYRLIWQRALASQMAAKELETTTVELAAGRYELRASATRTLFDGFARVYTEGRDDGADEDDETAALPALAEGDATDRPRGHARPSTSRSRRRASPRRRSSRRSRSTASAARRRTRRRSRRSSTAATSGSRSAGCTRSPSRASSPTCSSSTSATTSTSSSRRAWRRSSTRSPAASAQWVPLLRAFYGPLRDRVDEKRRELKRARLHHRGDGRGLLRGPPDGHPARAQRPVPGLLAVPRAQGDRGRCPATSRRPRRAPARSARSAARARSSASAAGSGRSSAARAIPTATTSRRTARRRPTRCRSRSTAPRTATATSCRVARGAPGTSSAGARATRSATSRPTTSRSAALHDADDGPLARKGEAAICLVCGAASDTGPDDIAPGERSRAARPIRAPLARPGARRRPGGGGTARRAADAAAAHGRPATVARARSSRPPRRDRGRGLTLRPIRPLQRFLRPSTRATPRRTPCGPMRRPSVPTSTGWPSAGVDWRRRRGPTCAPTSPSSGPAPPGRRSPSGWPRSARSTASPPARAGRRATRGARSPRRACRGACRACSRSSRSSGCSRPSTRRPPTRRVTGGPRAILAAALALRDRALVETAYAAGLRISELAAADLGALDLRRGEIRVLGKGRKERIGLLGRPAARPCATYLEDGRRSLLAPASARRADPLPTRSSSTTAARPLGVRGLRFRLDRCPARRAAAAASRRTRCATRSRPTCSTAARTCASSRSCSATRAWRRPRSTPTSRRLACAPLPGGPSARAPRPAPPSPRP